MLRLKCKKCGWAGQPDLSRSGDHTKASCPECGTYIKFISQKERKQMGSRNPGRFRREGREAFRPEMSPEDLNPYTRDTFWDKSHAEHWLEGWKEAEDSYIEEMKDPESEEDYLVMAKYPDGEEVDAGEITLRAIKSCRDMPIELEIDGVVYKPEF